MNIILVTFAIIPIVAAVYGTSYFKVSNKTYIYIVTLIMILGGLFFERYEKYLMPAIFLIILILLYKEIKSVHALVITAVSILIAFIGNSVIGITSLIVLDISVEAFRESLKLYALSCVIGGVFTFYLGTIFRRLAIKYIKEIGLNLKNKIYLYIILLVMFTISLFYVNMVVLSQGDMYSNNILMIIQVLLCLGYSILLIFIFNSVIKFIKKECEIKAKEQEYEDFKEYTRNLESIYKEMRGFRHDYVNILSSINIYIEEKNLEGLRTYFNNNILKMSNELTTRDYKIACLQNIKIPEIKGIISSKIIRAQEMGIDIDVEVLEEIEEFNINTIHLCRILGILLDNAIEEVIHCEFKKIRFAIIKKMDKVIIVVINNCRKSVPPIHKILKEGFSTKGNERGIGLSNLKSILSNYPKAIIETKVTDNEFVQCIEF